MANKDETDTDQKGEGAEEGEKDPDPLETNAPYPGRRRGLVYPPELDKMLEKAFKEDFAIKFTFNSKQDQTCAGERQGTCQLL
ncbi:hypothetical protein AAFF_G00435790 [Aldrovandia affinis]|uniref:Uncharacterized protein n=1 Tax=Aldrovandia affinis TaxID=143900 RepID=A0AAD7R351_9TELE|nr:hypothetical protein AAFF_G00435790 [Aldrovandia affinis]